MVHQITVNKKAPRIFERLEFYDALLYVCLIIYKWQKHNTLPLHERAMIVSFLE